MKISVFLLAAISVISTTRAAPAESDRLPQFLQALPFFSDLQSLQQTFQELQANIPAEVMSQLQQTLPPFLVNFLTGGQQSATTRTLQDLQSQLPQLIQTLTQLQSSLPPEVLSQLQQSLPPLLSSLLGQTPPAGRTLQEVATQLQTSLPPFLANLLASQLSSGGSSQLLQQLQTVLPPEVFQQLQQVISTLQPAAGRNDNDDIETNRKRGGGKHGWWKNPSNNNNYYQKPSYGNYQKPTYGNYQKPTYGNVQNPYYNQYQYYNPNSGYQKPNYNIGTIGDNGVIIPPATGTGAVTTTATVTAIRDQAEQE